MTINPASGNLKPIIGLVGGIGSGKSRVAAAFEPFGAMVLVADRLGHEALEQPAIRQKVLNRWGERVVGDAGQIERKKLASIVFGSPVERANLEHLVFPWIERRIGEEIARGIANPHTKLIVLDAPVMIEAGWHKICDRILYVHAPRAVRLNRVTTQRGWSAEELMQRETVQLPLTYKATLAHSAIDNSGTDTDFQPRIEAILKEWELL